MHAHGVRAVDSCCPTCSAFLGQEARLRSFEREREREVGLGGGSGGRVHACLETEAVCVSPPSYQTLTSDFLQM
jgi:hypothetical protein